jgi:hypothetical protein
MSLLWIFEILGAEGGLSIRDTWVLGFLANCKFGVPHQPQQH